MVVVSTGSSWYAATGYATSWDGSSTWHASSYGHDASRGEPYSTTSAQRHFIAVDFCPVAGRSLLVVQDRCIT